jgi:hypothetical protein
VRIRVCSIRRRASRCVERRQRQRAIPEDLDELAAGAEEEDRTELRVQAAADVDWLRDRADVRIRPDP